MKFKHLIPLYFFIVTWNQWELVWTNDPGVNAVYISPENRTYEVHITTRSQQLERKIDVERFRGRYEARIESSAAIF